MAMHDSDIKVAKTASACLANITSLHSLHKHQVVTTGLSFLQRINGATVKEMIKRRIPAGMDLVSKHTSGTKNETTGRSKEFNDRSVGI
jgi:hypothetical protein